MEASATLTAHKRRAFRVLSQWLAAAARWAYSHAHPRWAFTLPFGWYYRGRRVAREPGPAWRTLIRRDPCVYCGRPSQTVDHVHPKMRGGASGWTNEVGACQRCNHAKGSLSLLEFLRRRHQSAWARQTTRATVPGGRRR